MITLITAVPGSGKTLYAVSLINELNNEGKVIYQNIAGLKKELFKNPELIFDAPADWRDTPHGSTVIYDECQQPHLYPATAQRGQIHDERLTAMETHRHSGHDLIFITQAPTLVHHHVRKLTGKHIHLYRARGLQSAMRYEWSHVCDDPNNRQEQQRADSTMWRFPKQFFQFYQSATIHTHKFSMPTKLKIFLFLILPTFSYFAYSSMRISAFKEEPKQEQKQEIVVETKKEEKALFDDVVIPKQELKIEPKVSDNQVQQSKKSNSDITGCVNNKRQKMCACYGLDGKIIDISYKQCMSIASKPISKSILRK